MLLYLHLMILDPCHPVLCGANSVCDRVKGECHCAPGFKGSPPDCVREVRCRGNSECRRDEACHNGRCLDPCHSPAPRACGVNTRCFADRHAPICRCEEGFIGDPFRGCQLPKTIQEQGKSNN